MWMKILNSLSTSKIKFSKRQIINSFIFCVVMWSFQLFAQSNDDLKNEPTKFAGEVFIKRVVNSITEEQAVELALNRSRELKSRNTNVQIADYRFNSAGKINNPVLRISDVSTKYYTDEFDELRVGVRWKPPSIGERTEEKQQARVRFWDRKVTAIRYRNRLVARVRRNYANVIMYNQLTELAQKRVAFETERIEIIGQMVDLGRRTIVYQTKAKMWLAESKNDVARTIQSLTLARRKLYKKTGISGDVKLIEQKLPEITQDLDQLIAIAFANRPEIELVQQRILLASSQKHLEFNKLLPWFSFIELSYHKEAGKRKDWGELKVGVNLPVFNWNLGNIKATDLAVKRKEGESDAVREAIEDEVEDAYILYRDILLDWKNFSRDAGDMITEARKVVDEARRHETLQADEVLEMELTIIETEKILCEKRRDLAYALVDLYYVLGIEGPEKLHRK